ncbi:MAG: DUF1707 SHOCT-like domain-containing protein [Micromonosporaceae bacterium]
MTDADREAAAAHLREHFAQGRLASEEFNQRLDAVFTATTQSRRPACSRIGAWAAGQGSGTQV